MSKIISTFQPPTAVLFSAKCRLTSAADYLVTATLNNLDVYSIKEHGLEHESTLEIWGQVVDLKAIPNLDNPHCSDLLVMLDHPDPELIFLTWSELDAKLVVRKNLSLYERTLRPAEFLNTILVHPTDQLIVIGCYTCRLKVITAENNGWSDGFDVSLTEANLLGLCFLPTPDYSLAILHIDHNGKTQLLSRDISLEEFDLQPSTVLAQTAISSRMLPCPDHFHPKLCPVAADEGADQEHEGAFRGGVLIIGGKKILLYEHSSQDSARKQKAKRNKFAGSPEKSARKKKARATIEWPWGKVTACTQIPDTRRFLIGDAFGKLALLSTESLDINGLILLPLGEASPAETVTYLTNGVIYVGSYTADAQTLKITTSPHSLLDLPTLPIPSEISTISPQTLASSSKGKERVDMDMDVDTDASIGCIIDTKGSFLQVLGSFKNIAPINDAVLVQSESDDQRQIVTCSGQNEGSLHIIRTGADFEKLGRISTLQNVTKIWPIKMRSDDLHDSYLVASTLHHTQVFHIESAGILSTVQATADSFITNSPTLCVANVASLSSGSRDYRPSPLVIQVTSKAVHLLEYNEGLREFVLQSRWDVTSVNRQEIVAADINKSQVLMGLGGCRVAGLTVEDGRLKPILALDFSVQDEISAVSCQPLHPAHSGTEVIAIGLWGASQVQLYTVQADKAQLLSTSPDLPAPARSLVLYNFGSDAKTDRHAYLICGLLDGSVASMVWDETQQLRDLKVISLGSLPVCLSPCHANGKNAIFAAGTRATLLSWDKRHLTFAPVISRDTAAAAPLFTQAFKSCLILSKPDEIVIGQVKDVNKLHIRSVPLGRDRPIKIIYDPSLHVFGVACTRTEPDRVGTAQMITSSFRLLDDSSLTHLSQYNCDSSEEIASLHHLKLARGTPLFCVGTFFYDPEEVEPSRGRIIIFTTDRRQRNLQLEELSTTPVKGCVFSLTSINDMLAVACNSSVMLFRVSHIDDSTSSSIKVERLGQWCHNYMVTQLAVFNRRLVVGDAMHSVTLLNVSEEGALETVARDYIPLWPMAVEAVDENNVIGANDGLNLFSFTLQKDRGRTSLKRDGFYHYGDAVSKIIRGTLGTLDVSSDVPATATHLIFTSSGRISVVVSVKDNELAKQLGDLQRNLAISDGITKGVGNISHARFRAPKNTRGRSDADEASYGYLDGDLLERFLTCENEEKILAGQEGFTQPIDASPSQIRKVLETFQELR